MTDRRWIHRLIALACATLGAGFLTPGDAADNTQAPGRTAPAGSNFGFPLSFDPSKMDVAVTPGQDFPRHAAGRWLDAATVPADRPYVSGVIPMVKHVEDQVADLLGDAMARSPGATRGSALQLVGDFYASGMDVAHRQSLGAEPVKPLWTRIDGIGDAAALARMIGQLGITHNGTVLLGAGVIPDLEDPTRYIVAVVDGELALPSTADYLAPERAGVRSAYLGYITDALVMAGVPAQDAGARAAKVLEMETRVAAKRVTPERARDPHNVVRRMSFAALKTLLGNVDVESMFQAMGLPARGEVLVVEGAALEERNAMLAQYPLQDTRDFLKWEVLRRAVPYLSPGFMDLQAGLIKAMTGQTQMAALPQRVGAEVANLLGHPLGRLYVARYFPAHDKAEVDHLVGLIRKEFRNRLVRNTWLSPATRARAIDKLDRMRITVGYPERWIDYTSVDVRRDDYHGNLLRLNTFLGRRNLMRLGKPVAEDSFADPRHNLPTVVNAGYDGTRNAIEIPAAFLQPPFYAPKADVAVKMCTMGAVIGHEMTHGFDATGRLFDAKGAMRDWWTAIDARAFAERSRNLIAQAAAFEALPGVRLNGNLTAGENLADIGGLNFAYDALQRHLKSHPGARRVIDGFTPEQRCFLAWGQNWADKSNADFQRQTIANDPHPPGVYRMIAPAQNTNGFYAAFGIRPGDRMWRDPKDRVSIW